MFKLVIDSSCPVLQSGNMNVSYDAGLENKSESFNSTNTDCGTVMHCDWPVYPPPPGPEGSDLAEILHL